MSRRSLTIGFLALLVLGQLLFGAHFVLHDHALSTHSGRVIHADTCHQHEGHHGALPEGADEDLCQYFWLFSLAGQAQVPAPTVAPQAPPLELILSLVAAQEATPALTILAQAPSHSPPLQA
jgi:hypothetical protein